MAEVSSMQFWKQQFQTIATTKQFQEYIVMQVDHVPDHELQRNSSTGAVSTKVCSQTHYYWRVVHNKMVG